MKSKYYNSSRKINSSEREVSAQLNSVNFKLVLIRKHAVK